MCGESNTHGYRRGKSADSCESAGRYEGEAAFPHPLQLPIQVRSRNPRFNTANRRTFLESCGAASLGALVPSVSHLLGASTPSEPFQWKTDALIFTFDVTAGRLRQKRLIPADATLADNSSGVEVALQCSGENSPDQGMKSGVGQPGARLVFLEKREEPTSRGKHLGCTHTDPLLRLRVESFYETFNGLAVVRRYSRVSNEGTSPVGIEFLSSAMLHGLADPQNYDRELRIHLPFNSWMAEGQWHSLRSSEMGFVKNERTAGPKRKSEVSAVGPRSDICRWPWPKT
jgi:alpha-galactosidase